VAGSRRKSVYSHSVIFADEDLLFLLSVLLPAAKDTPGLLRVLREDQEILDGMISDERVFHHLLDDPLSVLSVSPALFFAILLARVASDLARHPVTFEHSHGLTMALFDAPQVLALLENRQVRDYLTDMLVSFVRINSFSTTVRVRKGIWRRVRFSDFDIDHLVRYGNGIEESQRFPVYKRIADICLFTLGIFAPTGTPRGAPLPFLDARALASASRSREEYIAQGTSFYTLASRHREARSRRMSDVLSTLAEKITLAAKPLSVMSARYLQPLRDGPARPGSPPGGEADGGGPAPLRG
jgi:hypothetical protein